jgi:hypothetical protein
LRLQTFGLHRQVTSEIRMAGQKLAILGLGHAGVDHPVRSH